MLKNEIAETIGSDWLERRSSARGCPELRFTTASTKDCLNRILVKSNAQNLRGKRLISRHSLDDFFAKCSSETASQPELQRNGQSNGLHFEHVELGRPKNKNSLKGKIA
jgi:hypothetical protein